MGGIATRACVYLHGIAANVKTERVGYSTNIGDHLTRVERLVPRSSWPGMPCVPATAVGLRHTYRCRSRDHIDVTTLSLSLSRTQPPYRTSFASRPGSREPISSSSCCHGMDGWRSADNARCGKEELGESEYRVDSACCRHMPCGGWMASTRMTSGKHRRRPCRS